jgi:hypothetical protein
MKISSTPIKPVSKTVFNKDKPREEPSDKAARFSEYMKDKDDG